jgi:hypothetical protein
MENDLAEQIKQRLAELPPNVLAAVQSADLGDKVRAIGQKQGLHIDQLGELEDETLMVMLGFSAPEDFGGRLSSALKVSREQGDALAQAINNDIFLPIREYLKKPSPKPVGSTPQPTPATNQTKVELPAVVHEALSVPLVSASAPKSATVPEPTPAPQATKLEPPKPEPYKTDPYREIPE